MTKLTMLALASALMVSSLATAKVYDCQAPAMPQLHQPSLDMASPPAMTVVNHEVAALLDNKPIILTSEKHQPVIARNKGHDPCLTAAVSLGEYKWNNLYAFVVNTNRLAASERQVAAHANDIVGKLANSAQAKVVTDERRSQFISKPWRSQAQPLLC